MDFDPTSNPRFWQSRSCTKQEISKISALLPGIESLLPQDSLQTVCVMPPLARNGAEGVVVLQSSGFTVVVTTPYGMLLLSCTDELDASSVGLVTSSIKEYTEGQVKQMAEGQMPASAKRGVIRGVQYPDIHEEVMSVEDHDRMGELEDTQTLLYSLREIAETSEDAESVRVAFIALTTTASGQAYMEGNPIKL